MAEIFLRAISGVDTDKMMKIQVTIVVRPLLALIDSGSTHNLIDATREIELPTCP